MFVAPRSAARADRREACCDRVVGNARHDLDPSERLGQDEAKHPRRHLLVEGHAPTDLGGGDGLGHAGRQLQRAKQADHAVRGHRVEPSERHGRAARGDHADRDRLAVEEVERRDRLDRVAEGVAEVEERALPLLERVARDDRRLDGGGRGNQAVERRSVALRERHRIALERRKQRVARDDGVLRALGEAGFEPAALEFCRLLHWASLPPAQFIAWYLSRVGYYHLPILAFLHVTE